MAPQTCINFLSKPTKTKKKKKKKEEKNVLSEWNKKVNEWHMKTKCPMQPRHFPKEEDNRYAPHLEKNFIQKMRDKVLRTH
jgi:hypothetical protein